MDKICLLYQPSGLGDILFIQKICKYYYNSGYKIILPVVHEFKWLNNYIENVEFISWEDKEKKLTWDDRLPDNIHFPKKEFYHINQQNILTDDFIYINFFRPPQGRTMSVKYDMLGLDYTDWADYLTFNRNKEKYNLVYTDLEATSLLIENNLIFTRANTFQLKIQKQLDIFEPSHFLIIIGTKPDNDITLITRLLFLYLHYGNNDL